jgi:glycosyltransferase involved in cell wall biosynthesis/GT2 family glycosyltransferase
MVRLSTDGDAFVRGVSTVGSHPNAFLYDPLPIWRALRAQPDLLDLHEEPFALATAEILVLRALMRNRVPYVLYSAQNIDKRYPIPFRWFESYALRHASGAYVCNVEAGEILQRKGLRARADVIPLGVDVQHFAPAPRSAPDAASAVIGYVGRLERHKGVSVLLRAIAGEPGWSLRITGDGPERAVLESLARELGLSDRVAFLGFADGDELARRYREVDVVAVPSIPTPSWLEQFCRVAVEAMASGVPVVASRTGAIPDVVDTAGILVTPDDPDALRDGLRTALEPERWTGMRESGIERSRAFTWERVAAQHADLYRRVAGARDAGTGRLPQVVVVAYGEPDLLAEALATLGRGFSITIVDNSSLASTRTLGEEHGAFYIDPGANLGFGAGVNVALRSLAERGLTADDVLLLNPDARIAADQISAMHTLLHEDRLLAVVGATQTEPGSNELVRVWWPFPHPARAWVEALGLGRLNRARDFAIGSILLLRSEAIADVGLFDERFFLYAEEVDWQKRATDNGWRITVAAVAATHVGGGTSTDSDKRERLFHASAETYVRKHFGSVGWQVYRAAMVFGAALRGVVLPGERGRAARRRRDLYLRGPHASSVSAR